ncbi:MAG: transketolase [Rubrivivax sp.]|nr:transketolase [Rubrivivax sp.]
MDSPFTETAAPSPKPPQARALPLADALRFLAADAVQAAASGHPGAPLGMAEMAEALWHRHLKHDPAFPSWPDRDRFVLSNGHASMLLYALLHLTGYALPRRELERFRQFGSRTPGHPEHGMTPGVETTTGPLGQGLANAVGMALAEKLLAGEFNRPGHGIVDHHTYVFAGDGCLMEGVAQEAISLAGTLGLSKLIVLYDDNGISIDGDVRGWFRDDTPSRFAACGWRVIGPLDGHDSERVAAAIAAAKTEAAREDGRPTLIDCRTEIGHGAPGKAGSADTHGAPLGAETLAAMRAALGWPHAPFEVPEDLRRAWDARERGGAARAAWEARFVAYRAAFPALAEEFERRVAGRRSADFDALVADAVRQLAGAGKVATRKASQLVLDAIAPRLPELLGGSADLTGSNLTDWKGCVAHRPGQPGRHLSWGVREFGMAAAMNGIALHGGFVPFGGTFLVFSDYSRNAIRMAALMKQRVVHVFTHDSIGLGEDGPTHQAVEQLPALRLIPNLDVWRPADGVETAVAWGAALAREGETAGPSALALSRQALPALVGAERAAEVARGGYVLAEESAARATLIATGSELALAVQAQELLRTRGIAVRVVSMPCTSVFDRQPRAWREQVLRPQLPALAIEAAQPDYWRKYVGLAGDVMGIGRFGESAPAAELFRHFGLTAERAAARVERLLG